jgi:DNA-binding MarR family transcriptional regulator
LHRRRLVRRRKATEDGRVVLVSLTPSGRRKIEDLFPRFNLEEVRLASPLAPTEQEDLATMLRSLLRGMDLEAAEEDRRAARAMDPGPRRRDRRSV